MTFLFNGPTAPGTGLYFQSGNEDLPMDKLQSFWPLRAAGGTSGHITSPDLVGNSPLGANGVVAWAASNPVSGGALGCADFSQATNYWMTRGDPTDYCGTARSLKWWLSFWFYPKTGASGDVICARAGSTTTGWFVNIDADTGDKLGFYMNNGTWGGAITSNSVVFDAWNFGIVGWDTSTGFASLNGGTAATLTRGINDAGATWGISFGSWLYSGNDFLGYVADAAYFVDVAANATATEIAALYNGGNGNTLLGG